MQKAHLALLDISIFNSHALLQKLTNSLASYKIATSKNKVSRLFGMTQKTGTAYFLRIILQDTDPVIWRTLVISSQLTLDRLHDVIQIVMGWEDAHLHQFVLGDQYFTSDPESLDGLNTKEEGTVRISELLTKADDHIEYQYDFGDDWIHTITLEKIEEIPDGCELKMACLDGRMACPPEDVGGVPGFEHFCEVMKDPKNPEYEDLKDWFGGKFKPRSFDVDDLNDELTKYTNWTRPRLLT